MANDRCDMCNQTFNSDRELQEHRRNAHPQSQQSGQQQGQTADRGQKREKIA